MLDRTDDGWFLQSSALKVSVSNDGFLLFYDAAGQLVRREEPPVKYGHAWQHKATLPPEACIYGLGERAAGLDLRPGNTLLEQGPGGGYGTG